MRAILDAYDHLLTRRIRDHDIASRIKRIATGVS
jgi:hypothetical protein